MSSKTFLSIADNLPDRDAKVFWGRRRTERRRRSPSQRRRSSIRRRRSLRRHQTTSRRRLSSRRRSSGNRLASLIVVKGQVTFDSEGNDNPNSRYFSRKLHVPSSASGLTLGRGYDMKHKGRRQIVIDLTKAGIDGATARTLSKASGLKGRSARNFIRVSFCVSSAIKTSTVSFFEAFTLTTKAQYNILISMR